MSTLVLCPASLPCMGSSKRGKSLSDAENERLRHVIKTQLMPRYDGNQSAAGPKIGLTQSGLNRLLQGGGGSLATARALAVELGTTLADVLGWPVDEVPRSGEPRFGDHPAWRAASLEARRQFGDLLPVFAFDRADDTKGGKLPSVINAHAVFTLAKWWFDTASMEDRIAAERAEILRKKAEEDNVSSSKTRTAPRSGRGN